MTELKTISNLWNGLPSEEEVVDVERDPRHRGRGHYKDRSFFTTRSHMWTGPVAPELLGRKGEIHTEKDMILEYEAC